MISYYDEELSIENERRAFRRLQKAQYFVHGNELPSSHELDEVDDAYAEWCSAKVVMQHIVNEIKLGARA